MASKDTEAKKSDTKAEEPIRGMQNTARLSVWIAVVIIVVALIGYLTSRSSFTEHDVAVGMKNLSKDISGYLEGRNYEGELSFASITLKGNVFARVAVLNEPSFVLRNTATGEEMTVGTEYVVLSPSSAAMDGFRLVIDKPLVIRKGDAEYRIIPQAANEIQFKRENSKKENSLRYAAYYKEGMNFIVQTDGLPEAALDSSYLVHFGAESALQGALDMAEKSYFEQANLVDASVEIGQTIIKMKEMKAVYEVALSGESNLHHYDIKTEGVQISGKHEALGVFSLALELEDEQPLGTSAEDHHIELNTLNIKGEDFQISGKGQLDMAEGELLPYGALTTEITALDAVLTRLANATVIPSNSVALVSAALQSAATPAQTEGALELNFQRTPGGAFMIGSSTFEELTVSLLRDMVKGAAVPAPAVDAPKDAAEQPDAPKDAVKPEASAEESAPAANTEEKQVPAVDKETAPADAPKESMKETLEESGDAIREAKEALEKLRETVTPEATPAADAPVADAPKVAPATDAPAPAKIPSEVPKPTE